MNDEPNKTDEKPKEHNPFELLAEANRRALELRPTGQPPAHQDKEGSWPPRKVVGRLKER